ncbi:MAG: hypothetical protein ACRER4_04110, partial [Steroidobacteraceae bacterium]
MRKLWWSEPLYEMKPYGVLALGLFAALIGAVRSWAVEVWDTRFTVALVFSVVSIAYAVLVMRMR